MKLRPLNDRLIVCRESGPTHIGRIELPQSVQDNERPTRGEVLHAGPGKKLDDGTRTPMDVKKGDTVLFSKYSGSEVEVDGQKLLIMREDDVLAVVE